MKKMRARLFFTSIAILFWFACSSSQNSSSSSSAKKTVESDSPPPVTVPSNPDPENYLPPDIDDEILSAYGSPTLYPVALSYESVVATGQTMLMQFTPPSPFEIIDVPGVLYTANTALLTNPQQLTTADFPAKFTATAISLSDHTFPFTFNEAQQLTGIFVWAVGENILITPLFHLTIYSASSGSSGNEVEMTLKEIDGLSTANAPITVAQVFPEGLYMPGQISPYLVQTDQQLAAQVDVLRKNADGSIRHALISFKLPSFNAKTSYTIRFLHEATIAPAAFQVAYNKSELEARLDLTGATAMAGGLQEITPDPSTCVSPATQTGDSAKWRFNGPLMRECVTWGKLRHKSGGLNAQLDYSMRVRTYSGFNGASVDVVIENSHAKNSKSDTLSIFQDHLFSQVKLTLGKTSPVVAWTKDNVNLWSGTRIRILKQFQNPFPDPEKIWDRNILVQSRAVNMVNLDIPTAYNHINSLLDGKPVWPEPGDYGFYPSYFPQTGGALHIGTEKEWERSFLATMNRKALQVTQGMDSNPLGSLYEVHYRQSSDLTQQIPGGPIGIPCGQWKDLKPGIENTPGTPDVAHQPRVGFYGYLFTGDLYLLEEIQFWSAWSLTSSYPYNCMVETQSRAIAWGLRGAIDAAWITPDNDPRKAYFEEKLNGWLDVLATKTYKTTLFPKVMEDELTDGLVNSGRPHWVNARRFSPWQNSWICWASQLAARRKYSKAYPIRDWICEYAVQAYTVEDDPAQAWTGPDGVKYVYPAAAAMAYDVAPRIFYTLTPWSMPCDQNPWSLDLGPQKQPANWGEMYYYTYVNKVQEGYPLPNWCAVNTDGSHASAWTPDNGLVPSWSDTDWHEYGGEPAAVAGAEAVMDLSESKSTKLIKSQALKAYFDKHLPLKQAEGEVHGLNLVPTVLE